LRDRFVGSYKAASLRHASHNRPEKCEAGGVMVGLGEGAKRDAPASSQPLLIFRFDQPAREKIAMT
jgi:hypothetical protein